MMSRPTSLREMTLTGQVKREIHYRGTNNKVIEALKSKIPKKSSAWDAPIIMDTKKLEVCFLIIENRKLATLVQYTVFWKPL